jgi:hypothetical protein
MSPLLTWHIFQIIVDCLFLLLLWMLVFWISLIALGYCLMHCSLQLLCAWNVGKNLQNHVINLSDNDFGIAFELYLFATNIKREVCDVLDFFL